MCDAIESIAKRGDGWRSDLPAVSLLAKVRSTRENEAALEAVRWAFDSIAAAQGALDFPVDATVTATARRCINAVCDDPRISCLQVMILVESDIDQVDFACNSSASPIINHAAPPMPTSTAPLSVKRMVSGSSLHASRCSPAPVAGRRKQFLI